MLGLQYAGSTWLHVTNEEGICQHCGRLSEEIKAGVFGCHRTKGMSFKNSQYLKAPRHPLFLDCVMEIRNCGYCQNTRSGLCKRHIALKMFLMNDQDTKEDLVRYEK